ncbi:hypothetical protein NDU88_003628 [Pleurodeles waltl]|uniref:Uncharacterized protein n=1 Tax=Pleurodeles waltl TaxID=8319 RepID=A0AAV7T5V1_PLEWA|nr:hypothetical protein NDU88_003628 [Pleurodeles waltl]
MGCGGPPRSLRAALQCSQHPARQCSTGRTPLPGLLPSEAGLGARGLTDSSRPLPSSATSGLAHARSAARPLGL